MRHLTSEQNYSEKALLNQIRTFLQKVEKTQLLDVLQDISVNVDIKLYYDAVLCHIKDLEYAYRIIAEDMVYAKKTEEVTVLECENYIRDWQVALSAHFLKLSEYLLKIHHIIEFRDEVLIDNLQLVERFALMCANKVLEKERQQIHFESLVSLMPKLLKRLEIYTAELEILIGQPCCERTFGEKSENVDQGIEESVRGQSLIDVALSIKQGFMLPDALRIEVVRLPMDYDPLVALNSTEYTTLNLAGVYPVRLVPRLYAREQDRLGLKQEGGVLDVRSSIYPASRSAKFIKFMQNNLNVPGNFSIVTQPDREQELMFSLNYIVPVRHTQDGPLFSELDLRVLKAKDDSKNAVESEEIHNPHIQFDFSDMQNRTIFPETSRTPTQPWYIIKS